MGDTLVMKILPQSEREMEEREGGEREGVRGRERGGGRGRERRRRKVQGKRREETNSHNTLRDKWCRKAARDESNLYCQTHLIEEKLGC